MTKAKVSTSTDDFSKSQVPDTHTYSGLHIALVVVGGTIGIPAFLMAANIGAALGLALAVKAFILGCIVLGILGSLTALAGSKSRYSAYMLTKFAFGRSGAHIANLAIAFSLIGWFGVISNMFGQAMYETILAITGWDGPRLLFILIGSVLMVWVSVRGFKGLDKLALILVPVMALFLIYAASISFGRIEDWNTGVGGMTFAAAVSSVIGSYIAGVCIQPDYSRYAKNSSHAVWSALLALGVSFPFVLTMAAIPSIAMGEPDLIKVMIVIGIGLPAFLLLLLASLSSNVLCLYSAGLSLTTIFTRQTMKTIIIAIGIIGTAIAFSHATDYLIKYLILLGITIPPIASIYVVDSLVLRREHNEASLQDEPAIDIAAFIAWALAILVGYLASKNIFSITNFAAIDSIVVSGLVFLGLKSFTARLGKQS